MFDVDSKRPIQYSSQNFRCAKGILLAKWFCNACIRQRLQDTVFWGRIEHIVDEGGRLRLALVFADSDKNEISLFAQAADWCAHEPKAVFSFQFYLCLSQGLKAQRGAQLQRVGETVSAKQADSIPAQATTRI